MHRRFDKRGTIFAAMVVVVFAVAAPLTCRLLGMFPPNGTPQLMRTLLLFHFTFYLGFAVLTITVRTSCSGSSAERRGQLTIADRVTSP